MSYRMLADIDDHFLETFAMTGLQALCAPVRAALEAVDRSHFVPVASVGKAHCDFPLPIGGGQTISQPFIVALMTQLLEPKPGHRVLEVGTGSGYQAAVLAQLVREVYSLEIIDALATEAGERLQRLGYHSVSVRCADAYTGWPEMAPFDSIVVTAAIEEVPARLLAQLREGGRMILPLGAPAASQHLTVVEKLSGKPLSIRALLPVRFVPFIRAR